MRRNKRLRQRTRLEHRAPSTYVQIRENSNPLRGVTKKRKINKKEIPTQNPAEWYLIRANDFVKWQFSRPHWMPLFHAIHWLLYGPFSCQLFLIAPAQSADKNLWLAEDLFNKPGKSKRGKEDPIGSWLWIRLLPLSVLATFAYWTAVCLEPELLVMAKH